MTEELKSQLDYFKDEPKYLRKVIDELEQENKDLKKQIESQKGLITIGGKQQYEYLQRIDELKKTVENQKLEYEELQCDLSEVENACGCYQSENAELKQENKELKEYSQRMENQRENYYKEYNKYRSALEEIRENLVKLKTNDEDDFTYEYSKIEDKINEFLNLS